MTRPILRKWKVLVTTCLAVVAMLLLANYLTVRNIMKNTMYSDMDCSQRLSPINEWCLVIFEDPGDVKRFGAFRLECSSKPPKDHN